MGIKLNFNRSRTHILKNLTKCELPLLSFFLLLACFVGSLCWSPEVKPQGLLALLCRKICRTWTEPLNIKTELCDRGPRVGPGYPLSAFAPPLSINFLIYCSLLLFPLFRLSSLYLFSLLSIRSLSTRIVPLRFQAWGHRRRPNLGLVCFVYDCIICIA